MRLWASLYGLIWILLLEFLLAMRPNPETWVLAVHMLLGVAIIGITFRNSSALRESRVPGRVKRIAAASFQLSVVMAVLGVLLWFKVGTAWSVVLGFTVWDIVHVFHVLNALAIITQTAAVAIAYDMWEDHEFGRETAPGEVPPPEAPGRTVPS